MAAWASLLLLLLAAQTTAAPAPPAAVAFREALAHKDSGDHAKAAERFAALATEFEILADHARQEQLRAHLAQGHLDRVLELARAFATNHANSPVAAAVWTDRGAAHADLAQFAEARAAWDEARRRVRDDETRAELRIRQAQSYEAEDRFEEAATLWLELWKAAPAGEPGRRVERGLVALESRIGRPVRGAVDLATRAEALASSFRNGEALTALDEALAIGGLPAARREALLARRAQLLFRLRRYPEATEAYASLGSAPEHRLFHARSLARSGRIEESIAAFRVVAGDARTATGARALFLAGTLLEDDDPAEARAVFETVASRAPSAGARSEARWRLAWAAYRSAEWAEAATHLEKVIADTPDPLDRLRPRYWHARALAHADPEAASKALRRLSGELPYTYYGWRARTLLGDPPPPPPTHSATGLGTALPTRGLERARLLVAAGATEGAEAELAALRPRARNRADRLEVGRLLAANGDYHRAERLMLDHDLLGLAQGPSGSLPREAFELAWPRAFSRWLEPAATRHRAPPALVYAVMREESGYRPSVLSVVGAHGLTQIMPTTGERLAKELGRDGFETERLLDPATNLDLGAYYLHQLLQKMSDRSSAAIASYNAGPGAVGRWLRKDGALADDVWVESIPYRQTRKYVKRVLRSMRVYEALYPELQGGPAS